MCCWEALALGFLESRESCNRCVPCGDPGGYAYDIVTREVGSPHMSPSLKRSKDSTPGQLWGLLQRAHDTLPCPAVRSAFCWVRRCQEWPMVVLLVWMFNCLVRSPHGNYICSNRNWKVNSNEKNIQPLRKTAWLLKKSYKFPLRNLFCWYDHAYWRQRA